jgi:hypothetical protein
MKRKGARFDEIYGLLEDARNGSKYCTTKLNIDMTERLSTVNSACDISWS